jgi:hypothetical protein
MLICRLRLTFCVDDAGAALSENKSDYIQKTNYAATVLGWLGTVWCVQRGVMCFATYNQSNPSRGDNQFTFTCFSCFLSFGGVATSFQNLRHQQIFVTIITRHFRLNYRVQYHSRISRCQETTVSSLSSDSNMNL